MHIGNAPRIRTVLFIGVALLAGCQRDRSTPGSTETVEQIEEPVLPAGYTKVAPAPYDTAAQILAQTGSIFKGKLTAVQLAYDNCGGPRTQYVFSDGVSLAGVAVGPDVTLKVLGGKMPGGSWVSVSEIPRLALDSEYVVFLRNTDWTFSPVLGNLVFRREVVGGRELLVAPSGQVVSGWDEQGPVLSAAAVSEPVGNQQRGYRSAEPRDPGDASASGSPDPKPAVTGAAGGAVIDAARPAERASSSLASAPSPAELRAGGQFARPPLDEAAAANVPGVSVESFLSTIATDAHRAGVRIGGRVALEPYWRCWRSTRTAKAKS
jgi:hypothetical protein